MCVYVCVCVCMCVYVCVCVCVCMCVYVYVYANHTFHPCIAGKTDEKAQKIAQEMWLHT